MSTTDARKQNHCYESVSGQLLRLSDGKQTSKLYGALRPAVSLWRVSVLWFIIDFCKIDQSCPFGMLSVTQCTHEQRAPAFYTAAELPKHIRQASVRSTRQHSLNAACNSLENECETAQRQDRNKAASDSTSVAEVTKQANEQARQRQSRWTEMVAKQAISQRGLPHTVEIEHLRAHAKNFYSFIVHLKRYSPRDTV